MAVSFYNFQKSLETELKNSILQRFQEIVESHQFVDGTYNKLFEQEFAAFCGTKHTLLVANGTDALELSLMALGIKAGDKVIIPDVTFFATFEAVINTGGTPILADVDPQTGLLCTNSLSDLLAQHNDVKFIIPVHLYGLPAPIKKIETLCEGRDIKIIEDAAQAHGAQLNSKTKVGASGHLTTFSFYPTKNLGAYGDAGAITLNDDHLATLLKSLRNHGRSKQGHQIVGRNSRCDHLQAAVLQARLINYPNQLLTRRKMAKAYFKQLSSIKNISLLPTSVLESSSWHLFPIFLNSKQEKLEIKEFLQKKQIETALFYERPISSEPALSSFETKHLIHSQKFADKTLCLPMNPFLTLEDVSEVTEQIAQYFKTKEKVKGTIQRPEVTV